MTEKNVKKDGKPKQEGHEAESFEVIMRNISVKLFWIWTSGSREDVI